MSFLSGLGKIAGGVGGFMLGGPAGAAAGYGIASSVLDGGGNPKSSGSNASLQAAAKTAGQNAAADRNRYLDILNGGQNALNTSISSAVNSAMPSFNKNLEGVRESAVRRGMSTGDLGTSYEGDVASAFQKNIANAAGGQAMNLFNTEAGGAGNLYNADQNQYLDLLSGNRDYDQAQQNVKNQKQSSLFGGLGALIGNHYGGATGAQIGAAIGQGF